jgi:hypothetical protein
MNKCQMKKNARAEQGVQLGHVRLRLLLNARAERLGSLEYMIAITG